MTAVPPDPVIERSRRAMPSLRASLNRLAILANDSTSRARIARDDHLAFMAIAFHAKQLEHTRGILAIRTHPDSVLIARSMLEGWWQLKWASLDAPERAERWRQFSAVYDWRSIQDAKAAGLTVPLERIARTDALISQVGDLFLTGKARSAKAEGRSLPVDPYESKWYRIQLRQLVEEVGELHLYADAYDRFSDRHHWSPAGVGKGLHVEGTQIRYDAESHDTTAEVLSVSYHCLYETAILLNDHLQLGFQKRLRLLADRHLADHATIMSGGTPTFDDPAPGDT